MIASTLQQQTIAAAPGDWAQTLAFNQFDPSSANLLDALFTTAGTVDASASIENLAPVAAIVNLDVGAEINAWIVGGQSVASIAPDAVASVNLPAFQGTFDGSLDFAGPSGTVLPDITASQTQAAVLPPVSSASSPLLGTGTFDVDVTSYATSSVLGNGNLAVLLQGSVGASLSLQYDAAPPGGGTQSGGGSDGDGMFFLAPFILVTPTIVNYVTTTPKVVTLRSQTSGWTSIASFAQYNPDLGTLDEIILNVGNTIAGTFSAENLGNVPATVDMAESASMTVATPGDAAGVTATATDGDYFSLGAFDGSMDFAGISGRSDTIVDSPAPPADWGIGFVWPDVDRPGTVTLTGSLDLNAFTGTGTIALPVSTAGTSVVTGPSNLLEEITQQTGGTVSVCYVYTPAASPSGDGSEESGAFVGPGGNDDDKGPFRLMGGSPQPDPITPVSVPAVFAPGLAFIGGLMGRTFATAQPNQTFVIGAAATETIDNFSLTNGDRLDLTILLPGAPLAHDLANLGSFLSVTGQSPGPVSGTDTTLSISGPGGMASLVLENSNSISVVDLLSANALVLPPH